MVSRWLKAIRPPAPTEDSAVHDGTRYIFKATLAGGARSFELTDAGLSWQGTRTQVWPLESIAAIRLSYRPASMQPWRFRADIENSAGQRATLFSTTWHSISMMARQDDDYRAFIVELHRRLAEGRHHVRLTAGINPSLYVVGLVFMALIGIAVMGLLVRAVLTAQFAGALFLAAIAVWFAWQIGSFMTRNRPQTYTFDALPREVMP